MIEDIGDILKGLIENEVYVDRLAGIVQTISYEDEMDGKKVIMKIPASCEVNSLNCGEDLSTIKDLVPDSKKRSVMYFEDISGANPTGREGNEIIYQANIRFVAWINSQKLGKTGCRVTGPIMNHIINTFTTTKRINSGPYLKIQVRGNKIVPKTPAIFGRYTFPLVEKQFLMYPFDYFALDLFVEFRVNHTCLEDFVVDPEDECNDH